MEELLCELPLIASNNTGVIEMIENNKSGMLFENGNSDDLAKKIIELYNDEEKRNGMSWKKGYNRKVFA